MKAGTVARLFNAGSSIYCLAQYQLFIYRKNLVQITEDFVDSLSKGSLDESVVEAARERIEKLLAVTPQYPVEILDRDILLQHAQLAIASCYS